jgi:hypothetical protein
MRDRGPQRYQSDHVVPDIRCHRGIVPQRRERTRRRKRTTKLRLGFGIKGQCLFGIPQRLVHIITSREASGKIRKPHANCGFRTGIFNYGDVMKHQTSSSIGLPSSLLIDITNQPPSQVFLWVRQHNCPAGVRCLNTWCEPDTRSTIQPSRSSRRLISLLFVSIPVVRPCATLTLSDSVRLTRPT